jgi:thioredoxin reductase (NADPH)
MIENFIGVPSGLAGAELATRGVLQMLKFGASLTAPVEVRQFGPCDDAGIFHLLLDDGSALRARCVLIATGVRWRRLEAKNAERFERAGLYYAATAVEQRICKGADLVVVGAGNSAGQAAMFLSECANKVYMVVRGQALGAGMSDYLKRRIEENPGIEVRTQTEITEIFGDDAVTGVETVHKSTGRRQRLDCSAVFSFIGADALTGWLPPQVAVDEKGYVLTGVDAQRSGKWPLPDREPCALETTLPGVLAAGDVRSGSTKRVGFAVGDGSMAITCVHKLRALAAAKASAPPPPQREGVLTTA